MHEVDKVRDDPVNQIKPGAGDCNMQVVGDPETKFHLTPS